MAHEPQTHSPHLSYRDASQTQDPGLARGRHSQVDGTGPLVRPGRVSHLGGQEITRRLLEPAVPPLTEGWGKKFLSCRPWAGSELREFRGLAGTHRPTLLPLSFLPEECP